jgi:hypothetical protein
MDPKDQPLTALERQNVDSGTRVFDTEEEMREYMRAFQLEHEAVLKAVAEVHGQDDDADADEEVDDLDEYYGD